MPKAIKILFVFVGVVLLCCLLTNSLFAQSSPTSSPYSAYGIGNLNTLSGSRQIGMGRVGQAVSEASNINPANPAAAAELWRFTFDFYGFYQNSNQRTEGLSSRSETAGLGGLALVFKKSSPLAFSVGLQPYSDIGYNIVVDRTLADDTSLTKYRTSRSGRGGLHESYIGIAYQFFKGRLSVGSNLTYTFGSVERQWFTQVNNTNAIGVISDFKYNGLGYNLGLLANDTLKWIGKETIGRIGLTLAGTPNLNRTDLVTFQAPGESDTLSPSVKRTSSLPVRIGIGLSIAKAGSYTIALDYVRQDWSSFKESAESAPLRVRQRFAAGGEWIPNYMAYRQMWLRIAYRAGVYYEQNYIQVQGTGINQYGFTAGLGIPISYQSATRFQLGFDWHQLGQTSNGLIQEQNYRIYLGLSFVEPWFKPRKYD